MKKCIFTALILLVMVTNLFSQLSENRIAVLNLDAIGVSYNESITLTDRMRSELVKSGYFTVIERSEMNEILKEQGFQQSGCTSDECAVEIGKLLNINRICAGSVGKVGTVYTVTLRMIDVETGQILITVTEDCKCPIEEVLITSMKNIAQKLVKASKGFVSQEVGGKGDIYLKSVPTEAIIYIDGKPIQKTTPATIRDLESGEHLIKVVKGDFIGSKVINVRTNAITEENITLGKAKGGLKVYSTPAEAQIYIGDQYYGITPKIINNISAGDQLITLKKAGYFDVKKRVTIVGEQFTTVEVELTKPASLYISSVPSKASVNIRGQKMGKTPLGLNDLYPEKVYVEVSFPGYQTERRYVKLQEAFSTNERFELKKLPSLDIDSKPSGARVYINENFQGITPLIIDKLTDDRIKIVVKKNYYDDWQKNLVLQAGKDEKLKAELSIKKGRLSIRSNPDYAKIELDGEKIGNTPLDRFFEYGEYSISVTKPKFETITEKIIIDQPNVEKKYEMSYLKGYLILSDLTPGSFVFIDGSKTDEGANEFKVPIGVHSVEIEKSGYEGKTFNYISQEKQSKSFDGTLIRKTNGNALWRSLILPGWGQHYQEKSVQTWLYPILFVGSAVGSYLMIDSYNTAVKDYEEARVLYNTAYNEGDINSTWAAIDKAYDEVESKENTRNILFIATGVIWLWNVLDTVILPPEYERKVKLSVNSEQNYFLAGVGVNF